MELIKTEDEQGVMYSLSGDNLPENYVLSKQNCDEIFGVVDVEKLADEWVFETNGHKWSNNDDTAGDNYGSYKEGFKKAMELNKDKVFTLEDIEEAFAYGQLNQLHNQKYFSGSKTYVQSLQQPTEIEVEIVTETINDGLDEMAQPQYAKVPKLDSEGQLILKNI